MVTDPSEWLWSNYRTVIAEEPEKEWLDSDWLLSQFGSDRQMAITAYRRFVLIRDDAMARAYLSGAYTMKEIALHFGVHYMTVSRSVNSFEQKA